MRNTGAMLFSVAMGIALVAARPARSQPAPRTATRPQATATLNPTTGKPWVDWRVVGPFVVRAEFGLGPYQGLLGELGQLQVDLVRYLGVPPARQWIELYLFDTKRTYAKYLEGHLPEVPYRPALFVKSRGVCRVYAYRDAKLAVNLRHECTHALLHAVQPMVPLWLDEGLAEYFELAPDERAFDNPYLKPLRWNARFRMVPRLEKLEQLATMEKMGAAEYRYAWAWVHFMLHGSKEAQTELVGYLADVRAQTPPGLLSERLARTLPSPYGQLLSHLKKWKRR